MPKKILCIDDSRALLECFDLILSRKGYEAVLAFDGMEGLQRLSKDTFDMIILDLQMPRMDGVQFLKKIRRAGFHLPVLVVTGESCIEYAEQCADVGVNGYIRKPFSPEGLMNRVSFLLGIEDTSGDEVDAAAKYGHLKLREVMDYIHKNYSHAINIAHLSRDLGISSGYLARLFKKDTGETLVQYINRVRIMKAKALLQETDLTIADIMEKTGFSTVQHFFKQFKRYAGCTPKTFRN